MIAEILLFAFGITGGVVLERMKKHADKYDKDTLAAYRNDKGSLLLVRLAQAMDIGEDYAVVNACIDNRDPDVHRLPFVVNADKLRFYTNKGEKINEANWKELESK
jgi:hypothetical protein